MLAQRWISLAVLAVVATPLPAQLARCQSFYDAWTLPDRGCQVGNYAFTAFGDFYAGFPTVWTEPFVRITPHRIDLTLKMVLDQQTVAVPTEADWPDDEDYWEDHFFEFRLVWELVPLTTGAVFREALTLSRGTASFDLSQATNTNGRGGYCGMNNGAAWADWGAWYQSGQYDGVGFGSVDFGGYFCSPGPGPIYATFRDVEITYSLYLTGNASAVPEPATIALLATGLVAVGFVGWRRRR